MKNRMKKKTRNDQKNQVNWKTKSKKYKITKYNKTKRKHLKNE